MSGAEAAAAADATGFGIADLRARAREKAARSPAEKLAAEEAEAKSDMVEKLAAVEEMGVKQLKALITEAGLGFRDCITAMHSCPPCAPALPWIGARPSLSSIHQTEEHAIRRNAPHWRPQASQWCGRGAAR